ncbi:hypothetical protein [Vibrio cholerae]|uniref:hypothetical protein n=1 Tax=Vibrio cholerae TaxID=666 RepID=UPI001034D4CB|nr:hypothetical protein [Vibrio cholerae]EGR2414021.1 hypothetical protein [Vibrio cholerae]TBN28211.1 hypothetical protein EYC50_04930 [Vibrio cholerae]GHY69451.1 hypothetical protein VCSRO74_0433 [Vibrio cholerae]HDG1716781.1 hypothetical protein [Vibrio cholerae]
MTNKLITDAAIQFCLPDLIEGQLYQFKLNGYSCSGVYLESDNGNDDGAFYCNGKTVCKVSEAVQIKRMMDSGLHATQMMYRYADEALLLDVMLIINNAVEVICNKGPLRKQDEALDNLVNAHSAICKRLFQKEGGDRDTLQTPYPHLSAPAQPTVISLEPVVKKTVIDLATGIRIRSKCNIEQPFDVKRSIKSIGRRIYGCIQISDFERAARLHKVYAALKEDTDGKH